MQCHKSDICGNHHRKCRECWTTANPANEYPCFVPKQNEIRFKIFWGNHTNVSADTKVNQWLAENPDIELIEWQYQQVRLGDHSICIAYKEKENT